MMTSKETKKSKDIVSKVTDFFKRKKIDSKFKNAGEGHRLSEDSRQPILNNKPQYIPASRTDFSASACKAGEAALLRDEKNKSGYPKPKQVTNLNVKNEIEKEKEELEVAYDLRERAFGKEVIVEKPKQLSKVYFCCPSLFDYDIIGGYHEMEAKIFSYLESEAVENSLLASCLIIHSKCKNQVLLETCLKILETLIKNIIQSPNEPKFRKIRLENERIKQNIVQVEGAIDFLKAIGFVSEDQLKPGSTDEMETCLVMPDEACIPERLTEYLANLKDAEPIKPVLYRDSNVFHKQNLVHITEEDLPAEFFRISIEELKRQNQIRKQQIEESGMLLTKTMRENMKIRDKRKYRYVLIRIIFPNNWVLQGTFLANNQLIDILNWVKDCLKVKQSFFLSVPPIIRKITDFDQTIVDAELAPCSSIRLTFDETALNECEDMDFNYYLKDHLLT